MNNIRVLITGPSLQDPGGVANYYNAVLPWLADNAVDAHYVEIGSTHGGSSGLHVIGDQVRLWRAIGRFDPDVVHLNPSLVTRSFIRDGLFALQARLRRRKLLVFFRGWQTSFARGVKGPVRWYFRQTLGKADMFIVLASGFSEKLVEWGVTAKIRTGNTVVNDDDLTGFSVADKQQSMLDGGTVKLLFLARLEHEKGVVDLVDSVISLNGRGRKLALTIAGEGPAMEEIRCRIDQHPGSENYIRFAGYVRGAEKKEIFRNHHVFCMPSRYAEGMPNSIVEAMAFGMPVITCPVGGIADFFEDGRMGVLVEDRDVKLITAAIEKLVSDPGRMSGMARYNHDYASERFLASAAADMLRKCYLEIA